MASARSSWSCWWPRGTSAVPSSNTCSGTAAANLVSENTKRFCRRRGSSRGEWGLGGRSDASSGVRFRPNRAHSVRNGQRTWSVSQGGVNQGDAFRHPRLHPPWEPPPPAALSARRHPRSAPGRAPPSSALDAGVQRRPELVQRVVAWPFALGIDSVRVVRRVGFGIAGWMRKGDPFRPLHGCLNQGSSRTNCRHIPWRPRHPGLRSALLAPAPLQGLSGAVRRLDGSSGAPGFGDQRRALVTCRWSAGCSTSSSMRSGTSPPTASSSAGANSATLWPAGDGERWGFAPPSRARPSTGALSRAPDRWVQVQDWRTRTRGARRRRRNKSPDRSRPFTAPLEQPHPVEGIVPS
jgi:hypothetical protein